VNAGDVPHTAIPIGSTQLAKAALPAAVDGRLNLAKEKHVIGFDAEAGKSYQVIVIARSTGSRCMPYMRILDPAGKELVNTEEQIGRDPQVTFSPPASGTYRVELSSIDAKGGPEYFYRLLIRPPSVQDFRLSISTDNVVLGHGQTLALNATLDRQGGFGGPVTVTVDGLPTGVTASPLVIGAGQSSGILTLTAANDAALANGALQVSGEATDTKGPDGKPLKHKAVVLASLPRPGEGQVVARPVGFQMATTTAAVPLITLTPETTQIVLAPGQTVMVTVRTARRPNDNAANPAIALALASLPPGVSAETPAIPEKQAEVTIKLTAAPNAGPSSQSALLTGKIGNDTIPAPAIVVTVKK
jgi:hypothetical protein